MNKKISIDILLEKQARTKRSIALSDLHRSRSELKLVYAKRKSLDDELYKYFPVRLIAILESFLRSSVKELIDQKEFDTNRLSKIGNRINFDFDMISALHGKKVSLGEIVSHSLSLSSLESINTYLSIISDQDFLKNIMLIHQRWETEVVGKPETPILNNPEKTIDCVKRIFQIRHVICHEIVDVDYFSTEELETCIQETFVFLDVVEEYISNLLYPDSPLTQAAMTQKARDNYFEKNQQAEQIEKELIGRFDKERASEYEGIKQRWEEFCQAWSKFQSSYFEGGSMQSMVEYIELEHLADLRIKLLNSVLEEEINL